VKWEGERRTKERKKKEEKERGISKRGKRRSFLLPFRLRFFSTLSSLFLLFATYLWGPQFGPYVVGDTYKADWRRRGAGSEGEGRK
jgi:hypothetical protein